MGNTLHKQSKKKSVMSEQTLLKRAWAGISDNPQYHGNVFFLSFCKANPQYTKYFTLDPEMPLTIDVHISMHFSIIMETMGYLMVDYYKNPKQHDYFISYIAMVHKDMNLIRRDMFNFGTSLVKYLAVTFPTIITPDGEKIISTYIFNLVENISRNIENLKRMGSLDPIKPSNPIKSQLFGCITCQDDLVYGKTREFWIERKRIWEMRLEEWKRRMRMVNESSKTSSIIDNDEIISDKSSDESNDEDDTSKSIQLSAQVLQLDNISEISRQILSLKNAEKSCNQPSIILRTKKSGETNYNIVETIYNIDEKLTSNSEFESSFDTDVSFIGDNYQDTSPNLSLITINDMKYDSTARMRHRKRRAT